MSVARACLAIASLSIAACGSSTSGSTASSNSGGTVNIGFIGPLTGTFLQYGQAFVQGAQAAIDQVNKHGGVMGKKLHLVTADDGGDAVDGLTAARKMLALNNISGMLAGGGEDYQDMVPVLNSSQMVTMTHIGDPAIDHKLTPFDFSVLPSDALTGAAMAYYASQQHYHRIAIAFDASATSQTLVPAIKQAAATLGLDVVANPTLPVNVPSYQAQVQQILSSKPDAILTQLQPPNAGPFYSELAQAGGGSIPIVGSDLTLEPAFIQALGSKEAKNLISVEPGSNVTGPAYRSWLSAYSEAYPGKAPEYSSVSYYDGVNVLALAMIAAKSTDPKIYVKYILDVTTPGSGVTEVTTFAQGAALLRAGKKIKYEGVSSPMTFNKYHRVTGPYEVVKGTVSGQTTQVGTILADALVPLVP